MSDIKINVQERKKYSNNLQVRVLVSSIFYMAWTG